MRNTPERVSVIIARVCDTPRHQEKDIDITTRSDLLGILNPILVTLAR